MKCYKRIIPLILACMMLAGCGQNVYKKGVESLENKDYAAETPCFYYIIIIIRFMRDIQQYCYLLLTACSSCFKAFSSVARGQAIFNRINPSPSLPKVVPSFKAK